MLLLPFMQGFPDNSEYAGTDDKYSRRYRDREHGGTCHKRENDQVEDQCGEIRDGFFPEPEHCLDDENTDTYANPGKRIPDDGKIGKILQERCDYKDDGDRNTQEARCRRERAGIPLRL